MSTVFIIFQLKFITAFLHGQNSCSCVSRLSGAYFRIPEGWYRYIPPFKEGPKNRVYIWASEALNAYILPSRIRTASVRTSGHDFDTETPVFCSFLCLSSYLLAFFYLLFLTYKGNSSNHTKGKAGMLRTFLHATSRYFLFGHPVRQMLKSVFIVFDLKLSYEHRPYCAGCFWREKHGAVDERTSERVKTNAAMWRTVVRRYGCCDGSGAVMTRQASIRSSRRHAALAGLVEGRTRQGRPHTGRMCFW